MTRKTQPKASRPVTIQDVAKYAGVAPSTVSNVLTGRKFVHQHLRKTVLAAVEEMNYKPNFVASSLRQGRTNSIGIIVPDITNPFFSEFVQRAGTIAMQHGMQLLLMNSNELLATQTDLIDTLVARQVDGMIVFLSDEEISSSGCSLIRSVPTVLVDRGAELPDFDTVAIDNIAATRAGTSHLIEKGHSDITFVATRDTLVHMNQRVEGYRRAMTEAGLSDRVKVIYAGVTIEECRQSLQQQVFSQKPPTAMFASAYIATLGAIKAARQAGLEIPRDLSLLGFDDSDWMTVLKPTISTVAQPINAMVDSAWQLLMQRIGEPERPLSHVTHMTDMRVRESVVPCNG
ncbi:LacI family DNA-binding transcriptional regulator [Brucella sp. NBRC 12950]|jgi:LacI family transcriptional regulator|uniref:LacI family DNA-binding transcriptional regulator n=1 Tax=Brucella sp. NBRC 12950 TaxID=2994518 RepID=UPI0025529827|nr:LacI family DNA-binding transcriptional regulator [Brucella sp. NBRC 12950]